MSVYSVLLNGPTKRLVSNTAPTGHIIILLKTYTTYFRRWIFALWRWEEDLGGKGDEKESGVV